jgi:hypothetical protein
MEDIPMLRNLRRHRLPPPYNPNALHAPHVHQAAAATGATLGAHLDRECGTARMPWHRRPQHGPQETQTHRTCTNPRQTPARHWILAWTAKATHWALTRQRGTGLAQAEATEGHMDPHRSPRPLPEAIARTAKGIHESCHSPEATGRPQGAAKRATPPALHSRRKGSPGRHRRRETLAPAVEPHPNLSLAAEHIPEADCGAKKGGMATACRPGVSLIDRLCLWTVRYAWHSFPFIFQRLLCYRYPHSTEASPQGGSGPTLRFSREPYRAAA